MKVFMKKMIVIVTMFIIALSYINVISLADGYGNFSEFESEAATTGAPKLIRNASGVVISVMRIVSTTVAIVMLLTIAAKYMMSAPGERADLKKHLPAYIIGATVLFGVTGILNVLQNAGTSLFKLSE